MYDAGSTADLQHLGDESWMHTCACFHVAPPLQVGEKRQDNSGMMQGQLIKRTHIPKPVFDASGWGIVNPSDAPNGTASLLKSNEPPPVSHSRCPISWRACHLDTCPPVLATTSPICHIQIVCPLLPALAPADARLMVCAGLFCTGGDVHS
jgi:hypothetical protein